ncbi:MAG: hypothetical protein P8Y23_18785, partial [Candidatus Lokiarchaeota archaeon]
FLVFCTMINLKRNASSKIKSFKNDLAPIIFYFDIFPIEPFQIPILPIPMRIDKLLNGEPTAIILPNINKISKLCRKFEIQFDLELFFLQGFLNLIKYGKNKKKELTSSELDVNIISAWWEQSKNIMVCIPDLTESFTFIILEFIRLYSYIKDNNLDPNQKAYLDALLEYCSNIIKYFRKKIESNKFKTFEKNKITLQKLYFERRKKVFPTIAKIQVYKRASSQYETQLEKKVKKAIDLKVYEDNLIINKGFSLWSSKKYVRTTRFDKLNLENLLETIE